MVSGLLLACVGFAVAKADVVLCVCALAVVEVEVEVEVDVVSFFDAGALVTFVETGILLLLLAVEFL